MHENIPGAPIPVTEFGYVSQNVLPILDGTGETVGVSITSELLGTLRNAVMVSYDMLHRQQMPAGLGDLVYSCLENHSLVTDGPMGEFNLRYHSGEAVAAILNHFRDATNASGSDGSVVEITVEDALWAANITNLFVDKPGNESNHNTYISLTGGNRDGNDIPVLPLPQPPKGLFGAITFGRKMKRYEAATAYRQEVINRRTSQDMCFDVADRILSFRTSQVSD